MTSWYANMSEAKSSFKWFKFAPIDWLEVLTLDDATAGARFKQMILRLSKNEAPEGSQEFQMIDNSRDYSERQRQRISDYWNRKKSEAPEPPKPRPRPAPPKNQPPTKQMAYDFCAANNLPPDFVSEWYEWQSAKGFSTLKNWKIALKMFIAKKIKE